MYMTFFGSKNLVYGAKKQGIILCVQKWYVFYYTLTHTQNSTSLVIWEKNEWISLALASKCDQSNKLCATDGSNGSSTDGRQE